MLRPARLHDDLSTFAARGSCVGLHRWTRSFFREVVFYRTLVAYIKGHLYISPKADDVSEDNVDIVELPNAERMRYVLYSLVSAAALGLQIWSPR